MVLERNIKPSTAPTGLSTRSFLSLSSSPAARGPSAGHSSAAVGLRSSAAAVFEGRSLGRYRLHNYSLGYGAVRCAAVAKPARCLHTAR